MWAQGPKAHYIEDSNFYFFVNKEYKITSLIKNKLSFYTKKTHISN